MSNSKLNVSLVIPVYNEESYLALCLDAIAQQTVRPLEVIVVDNNSTDHTVAVAQRYPFVTVLHEPRQGVVHARDRGFNTARGDIIGRLDGDSTISRNWVEKVQRIFVDRAVDAVSGAITYRNVGLPAAFNAMDRHVRGYLAKHMKHQGEQFLYGANMAIRRNTWLAIRNRVCHGPHMHEDLDLANHLSQVGCGVVFDPDLLASIVFRQALAAPREFYKYVWSCPRVYADHGMSTTRYANRVALLLTCLYMLIYWLHKGYHPAMHRFSVAYALRNTAPPRISPLSDSV